MLTFCQIFVNIIFNLITEQAVPVFITACNVMFLVYVAERRKKVSSRLVYRNEDAVIVGSNRDVINHPFFCGKGKRLPNKTL
jgi:hypothetical protein